MYPPLIKPDTVSQLAAGFVISMTFFILHVTFAAYASQEEFKLQFCAGLSITMTLFGGILLKTNTDDEDAAGEFLISFMLMVINIGVLVMFFYQTWMGITGGGEDSAKEMQRKLVTKALNHMMRTAKPRVTKLMEEWCEERGIEKDVWLPVMVLAMKTMDATKKKMKKSMQANDTD